MNERIDIANLPYGEALFVKYLAEPSSVPDEWRRYFADARLNGERPRQSRDTDIHPWNPLVAVESELSAQPAYRSLALEFPAWQLGATRLCRIEKTIVDLARRAGENRLKPDELQGGTFTVTNGRIYGSLLSTPIINPPQSDILGLHVIQERPVVRQGSVVAWPMMYAAAV